MATAHVEAFNAFDRNRPRETFAPDTKIGGLGYGDLDVTPSRLAGETPRHRSDEVEVPAMEWLEIPDRPLTARWGARDSTAIARQVLG